MPSTTSPAVAGLLISAGSLRPPPRPSATSTGGSCRHRAVAFVGRAQGHRPRVDVIRTCGRDVNAIITRLGTGCRVSRRRRRRAARADRKWAARWDTTWPAKRLNNDIKQQSQSYFTEVHRTSSLLHMQLTDNIRCTVAVSVVLAIVPTI